MIKSLRSFIQLHAWTILFSMIAIQGLWVVWLFVRVPSESGSPLILGFSLARLAAILFTALSIVAWSILAYGSLKKSAWFEMRSRRLHDPGWQKNSARILVLLLFAGLLLSYLPVDRQQWSGATYDRFRPLLIWLTLSAAEILAFLAIAWRSHWAADFRAENQRQKPLLPAAGLALGSFLLLWLVTLLTRAGLTPDSRYWNEAGVPLLGFQILLSLAVSLAAAALFFTRAASTKLLLSGWKLDLLVAVLLWAAAAVLWSQTPMPRSYFAPGPYPPNQVTYPYSDAEVYDRGAQYVLIGQGLNNNQYADKPFYMLLLVFFHLFAGSDYLPVVQLQAVCLAVFPALLYWLAKSLSGRTAGLLAGLFLICQQTNAIAATLQIQVSHSRLMMTEFPTAFGLALLALLLVRWLKRPHPGSPGLFLAGGLLGVLVLLRANPLVLLPFILLLFFLAFGRQWRRALLAALLFSSGILLVIGPWFFLNRTPQGRVFIEEKIQAVFSQRYDEVSQPAPAYDLLGRPIPAATPTVTAPAPASPTPSPAEATPDRPATQASPSAPPGSAAGAPSNLGERISKALQFVPDHFFHNLILSALILPASDGVDSFSTLDLDLQAPYWKISWDGSLPPASALFLLAMLAILALGIGSAWQASRLAGLVPLVFLLAYHLSNALARTSGGRYLVPVDWVVLFYFALGLVQLCRWAAVFLRRSLEPPVPSPQPAPARRISLRRLFLLGAALLLLGTSLLWVGKLFPLRYPPASSSALLQALLGRGSLQQAGLSPSALSAFLDQPGAVLARGKGLYPRFYAGDQGEASTLSASFAPTGYSRLIIRLIGPLTSWVILPIQASPQTFADHGDITVLGCVQGLDIIARAVVVEGSPDQVYLSASPSPWTCP